MTNKLIEEIKNAIVEKTISTYSLANGVLFIDAVELYDLIRKHQPEPQGVGDVFMQVITEAVERGNANYWKPTHEHNAKLKEWKLGGFKGEEPQKLDGETGSIIDCISASVNQSLSPYLQTNTAHPCREVRDPESTGEDCGRTVQGGSINTTELEKVRDALEAVNNPEGYKIPKWAGGSKNYCPHCVANVHIGHFAHCKLKLVKQALTIINRMLEGK